MKYLLHIAKFGVAAVVIWLMLRSGKLHPEVIVSAAHRWPELLAAGAMLEAVILICGIRWMMLLRGQGFHLGVRQAISLTMIGTMFSAVIPGAVSGDLVKGYYVAREVSGRRTRALATILMDRIIGLSCLATVASIGVIWNRDLVFANRTLTALSVVALGGCLLGFVGLLVAVAASARLLRLVHRLPERLPLRGLIVRVADVLAAYHDQIPRLLAAFALSFPVHLLGCGAMLACLRAVGGGETVPAKLLLFAFPLGMLAISIPITPAGVGVGQAAFYAVCNMALAGSGSAGANAFTVWQAIAIPIYLLGLFPYLAYRKVLPETEEAAVA